MLFYHVNCLSKTNNKNNVPDMHCMCVCGVTMSCRRLFMIIWRLYLFSSYQHLHIKGKMLIISSTYFFLNPPSSLLFLKAPSSHPPPPPPPPPPLSPPPNQFCKQIFKTKLFPLIIQHMLHEKVQNGKKIALQSIDRNIN